VRRRSDDATRGGGAVEWISLALSVPGALLTVVDLAERLKLKERVQRLLERIRAAGSEGETVLRLPGRPAIDLKEASAAEVTEALGTGVPKEQQRT
jgi:hypothetical protein